jgi:aminopeptidase N
MNLPYVLITFFLVFIVNPIVYSQEQTDNRLCASIKNLRTGAKTTVASSAENDYDVRYVKLNLIMTNASTTLSGNAVTNAVVVSSSLPAYVFELKSPLIIDSVLLNGILCPITTTGVIRTVTLPTPLTFGTLFTAQVFYHGTPTSGTPLAALGINSMSSPTWGTRATFTLSESYHANEWWPCKQSLQDKIDSCDIWITVADSLKAGSNGILQAITPIDATHNRYEWKERYPIDYYLISAAVAPYVDYSYYMHFSGSPDSMLVQNYVYSNPATLPYFKTIIDSTGPIIDYFSSLYGRYPFWQEKYGHCMARLSGGMEHQTMSTVGFFEGTLIAHELGHQWFGDNVTCATWADIFVNEGFASYSEYLFIDHFRNHTKALNDIQGRQANVKSQPAGSVFVDDTTNEARIFSSRLSYNKGACVLHTLRFIINNDSIFFLTCKNYQQQMKDSSATIVDYKNVVKGLTGTVVNGIDIDTFFNQWLYLEGYPMYNIVWNQSGDDVYVKLIQTTSDPSVPVFKIPIELKLTSPTGDTIVRIINDQADQDFHFTWSKSMSGIQADPNYWLIYDLLGVSNDPTLGVEHLPLAAITIKPNPSASYWQCDGLPANSDLFLTDLSGREIWHAANPTNTTLTIPGSHLAAGVYLLRVSNSGNAVRTIKLIKH